MTMQTISITRALVQLKQLDDKISRAIQTGVFVSTTVGRNVKQKAILQNKSIDEVKSLIQGSYDKVEAFIASRESLKSAIVLSNATTKVKILDREMTVAEAIELKNTVAFRSTYLQALRTQLTGSKIQVDKNNMTLEAAIENSLNTLYGSEKSKVDASAIETVGAVQRDQKEMALLDPSKIEVKIEKLEKEISDIESELDFVLSESNSRTNITVLLA